MTGVILDSARHLKKISMASLCKDLDFYINPHKTFKIN